MIELVWVSDVGEAQSRETKRTLLWERWSGRVDHACPFGICLRPVSSQNTEPPFLSWECRPGYLQDPLVMYVGEAGIEEPMWVYLNFMRRAHRQQWFVDHPIGIREITGLTLTTPLPLQSQASQIAIENGILVSRTGAPFLLEMEFDGGRRNQQMDFRPHLPLIFQL
jgi:hypothetical protein